MGDNPHEHSGYYYVSEDVKGPMICSIIRVPLLGEGHVVAS